MMQFVYRMQFPAKYTKYAEMKSNCILYHLYCLLSLLQPGDPIEIQLLFWY